MSLTVTSQNSDKRDIVFVIRSLANGGAERVVTNLSSLLSNARNQCHIITLQNELELEVDDSIPIHHFSPSVARYLPRPLKAKKLASEFDHFIASELKLTPSAVFSNLYSSDFFLRHSRNCVTFILHAPALNRGKTLPSEQSRKRKVNRLRKLYGSRRCVAVSQGVQEDFQKTLSDTEIPCIYNPVMRDFVVASSNQPVSGIPEEFLLHAGRLDAQKRHDILIQAYAQSGVQTPLVLLGKGELESRIRKQIQDLGLEEKIFMFGYKKNPYPFMKKAKGLILSSEYEGLGMVLLESLVLGTPAVSFDCPFGPSEILPEHCLVPPLDTEGLSTKIRELEKNPRHFLAPIAPEFGDHFIAHAYENLLQ